MNINDFDYYLPENLIAQYPSKLRDESRLLIVNMSNDKVSHKHFYDIIDCLKEGDCLVINDSKVLPARIFGTKETTGAKVEFLLTKRIDGDKWETLAKPGKKVKPGDIFNFSHKLKAKVVGYGDDGTRIIEFQYDGIFLEILEELGKMPLPPYIRRDSEDDDKTRYQTVYCKDEGSVAAPTAGLHFTDELLDKIKSKGVKIARVTLHVGIGTFRPVKTENIEDHHMHFEEYYISKENADIINESIINGHRIVSVGTTSTRTLESAAYYDEETSKYLIKSGSNSTDIFIYPGYEFKIVGALITNFHLPKSTLLMLISALYDREKILDVYKTAVEEKYRFFSYGDAMFLTN